MSRILDLKQEEDRRDVVHKVLQLLSEGNLVGLPTETVYVLAAHSLRGDAVRRLVEVVGATRTNGDNARPPCVLGLKGAVEAMDYVPSMSPMARKLCRRCWPGPVTLELSAEDDGLIPSLPRETSAALVTGGRLDIRAPAHDFVSDLLRMMPCPLILSPDRMGHVPAARTAADLEARHGFACELVIDDGPSRYGEPSTVVRIDEGRWSVTTPGVVSETAVGRLASEVFLFVCTGNTCRSPLAEGLFRKLLAEKLQCGEEDLFDRGYVVTSAGLSAAPGMPASPESVTVGFRLGIDLRSHESQAVTERLLEQADRVYTMTRHHRDIILNSRPDLASRIEVLARDGRDVMDPMGGGMSDYERGAQEIRKHLTELLNLLSLP